MSGLPQQFGLGLLEQKEAPQAGLSATPPPSSAAAAADGSSSGGSGNYMTAVGVITAAVVLGTFGTTLLVFHLRRRRALANQQDATRCESRQQDEGEAGGRPPIVVVSVDANYEADRDPEIGGVGQRDEPTTTTAPTEGEADEVSSQQRNHDTVGDHISSKA
ncbi:hypothetical protein N2152v2_008562 [Parachlorella kessleri]